MRLGKAVGPPLLAWALAAGTVFTTCALSGRSPFESKTWAFDDPGLYMDIARHGYSLTRCAPNWCGNAGWFPAYPALVRAVRELGVSIPGAALGVTWFFAAATLVLLWNTFLDRRMTTASVAALLYAAFAPGQIFQYAMYPISLLAFLFVLYLWLLHRERWFLAGVAGAGMVLAYPVGVIGPAAVAVWLIFFLRRVGVGRRIMRAEAAVTPAVVAMTAFFVYLQVHVGSWNAYFLVQDKYQHHYRFPLVRAIDGLVPLFRPPFELGDVRSLELLFVPLVLVCLLVDAVRRRRVLEPIEVPILLALVALWVLASSTTHIRPSREDATLVPAAILIARLPPRLSLVLVVCAVALSVPMELLFLHDVLG